MQRNEERHEMIGFSNGFELSFPQAAPPVPVATGSWLFQNNSDGTLSVQEGSGTIEITITESARFNGSYLVATTDLEAGPINLIPPAISGMQALGETLTHLPGLWIYNSGTNAPAVTLEWERDGAPLQDLNTPSIIVTSLDAGTNLSVRETVTDTNGVRSATSASIAIPSASTGITVVETHTSVIASSGTTDIALDALQENDVAIVFLTNNDAGFTAPTGYTKVGFEFFLSAAYFKRMDATPDTQVSVPSVAKNQACCVVVLRGVHPTTELDAAVVGSQPGGTGTSITPLDITTVTDGAYILTYGSYNDRDAAVLMYPTGYTTTLSATSTGTTGTQNINHASIGVVGKVLDAAGLESPSLFEFDTTANENLTTMTFAMRPAP